MERQKCPGGGNLTSWQTESQEAKRARKELGTRHLLPPIRLIVLLRSTGQYNYERKVLSLFNSESSSVSFLPL
jgi:hypothetical protein